MSGIILNLCPHGAYSLEYFDIEIGIYEQRKEKYKEKLNTNTCRPHGKGEPNESCKKNSVMLFCNNLTNYFQSWTTEKLLILIKTEQDLFSEVIV